MLHIFIERFSGHKNYFNINILPKIDDKKKKTPRHKYTGKRNMYLNKNDRI